MGNIVGVPRGKIRTRILSGARSVKFVIGHHGRVFGRSACSVKFSVSNYCRVLGRGFRLFRARGVKFPVNFVSEGFGCACRGPSRCRGRSEKIVKYFLSAFRRSFVKITKIFIVIELGCGFRGGVLGYRFFRGLCSNVV